MVQKCPDRWKALNTTLRCSSNWFWITSGRIEGQLIVKPNVICKKHPFWQTIISSLPLNIPSIYPPKFPSAYKSDALHGDRNALVSFIRPQSCRSLRESGKKDSHHSLLFPTERLWGELSPSIPAMPHSTRLKISHRATPTRTQRAQLSPHGLLRPAHLGPGRPDIQGREPTFDLLSKVKQSKTHKKASQRS